MYDRLLFVVHICFWINADSDICIIRQAAVTENKILSLGSCLIINDCRSFYRKSLWYKLLHTVKSICNMPKVAKSVTVLYRKYTVCIHLKFFKPTL